MLFKGVEDKLINQKHQPNNQIEEKNKQKILHLNVIYVSTLKIMRQMIAIYLKKNISKSSYKYIQTCIISEELLK